MNHKWKREPALRRPPQSCKQWIVTDQGTALHIRKEEEDALLSLIKRIDHTNDLLPARDDKLALLEQVLEFRQHVLDLIVLIEDWLHARSNSATAEMLLNCARAGVPRGQVFVQQHMRKFGGVVQGVGSLSKYEAVDPAGKRSENGVGASRILTR